MLRNETRLDHVASKERVHLLVAVDALGCPCLLHSRADQELVGHGVQQIRQLSLLLAHYFDAKEQKCLRAHAAVVASFHHDDQKEVDAQIDRYTHLKVLLQFDDVKDDKHP